MFPPNPQGQPPGAAPAQPPQPSAAPPQPAGVPPQGGPQRVANIGFNQDVQNILLSRIQAMPPQAQKILDSVLTPQTIPVFLMLLPELKPLFAAMQNQQQPGPIGQGQPGQPPQGGPGQASPGAPGAAAAPSAAQPGGQPGQGSGDDDDDETDNPLVNNQASSGLVG